VAPDFRKTHPRYRVRIEQARQQILPRQPKTRCIWELYAIAGHVAVQLVDIILGPADGSRHWITLELKICLEREMPICARVKNDPTAPQIHRWPNISLRLSVLAIQPHDFIRARNQFNISSALMPSQAQSSIIDSPCKTLVGPLDERPWAYTHKNLFVKPLKLILTPVIGK